MKKEMTSDTCLMVGILLDEMKVKSGLVFNRHTGRMVGFVNLGSINDDLEAFQASLIAESERRKPELAESMLVVMVRLLQKPSFTFPAAQYPTSSLSGAKIYPIVWDVVEALELNEIQVLSITCDGLSANRKFFLVGRDPAIQCGIPYKTSNPFDTSRNIYYFCDVPHLLKTTRNCFSNSFAHSKSRKLKVQSL